MLRLGAASFDPPLDHVLCLGAHCDDIEIGCGGTVLSLVRARPGLSVTWVVFSSTPARRREALASARAVLRDVKRKTIAVESFRDGFFPYQGGALKEYFEGLKARVSPDLVLAPSRHDLHQDHRLVAELTWNTFRSHLVLEYEIAKYDGDLRSPNVFVHLERGVCRRKVQNILKSFRSQASRTWFSEDFFMALLRLRGVESNAPSGFAEAFHCRKLVLW